MRCKKCDHSNAPLKKCCENCGSILEGYTINNVTGEVGYRTRTGSFIKTGDALDLEVEFRVKKD